tara:strand:- start:794 stop:1696 length:903 start_codon:yes stop_codon:yes gene_type:complete
LKTNSNTRIRQLLLVLAGVVVLVAILLAPKGLSTDQKVENEDLHAHDESDHNHAHEHQSNEESSADLDLASILADMTEDEATEVRELEAKAQKVADVETKLSLYDSLIQLSIKNKQPAMVAIFSKQKAEAVSTPTNWILAGDNYFKAFRLTKNQNKQLAEGAVECYQKALTLEENNLKAKTALGVVYVEGASALGMMPMKGIGLLKEVLNSDPENIDALTNLGYFAIQSGQYDKAIERFKTILQIDPKNAEAYLYLTDTYLSQNQVEKGIETLEQYKSLVDDPLVIQQVDDYIKKIKNNN